ncbi:sugar fermentation stimulation protein SfsA [Gammaproteobacteria bacterium 45_16_T64]|nr:sugar fermentation stimulation protein SfsA [Gammaproteobacteria bacterium 45_16_T64]
MKYSEPLLTGTLIKRYKRFLADVRCEDGSEITIHCPNTGSMKNCAEPGSRVWFSDSHNDKRKYRHTWELVSVGDVGSEFPLAGINTGLANKLVQEAVEGDVIPALSGYSSIRREVKYGAENSRIDLLLESEGRSACYVEVKNVTLSVGSDGSFPDAVTERGRKHLRELIAVVEGGERAVLLFCVQHSGIESVRPADEIDPEYGKTLRLAAQVGVEIIAWQANMSSTEIVLKRELPVDLSL